MQNSSRMKFETSDSWTILSPIEQQIRRKIEQAGIPLKEWNVNIYRGILTGFNEAFIISSEKKNELIAADPKSAEIIRPILRGRDIKRYAFDFADLWLINTHNGIKEEKIPPISIDDYPSIKAHLDQYYDKLAVRADKGITPYNLRNCAYMNDLSKQKIIWGEISDKPKFSIDLEGKFCPEATTFLMTGEHLKYLLCFLNSTFSEYFFAKYGTTTGMGTLRWKKYLIELLPVPVVSTEKQQELETLLDALLQSSTDFDKNKYIHEINQKIYQYLDLSSEEISFIEEMVLKGAH